jgi:putative FmdB family regulatory protein
MPLYEYKCSSCGERLERRQGFNDPALTQCPTCAGLLTRLINPAPIIFKGSGWYCTDSRSSSGTSSLTSPSTTTKDTAAKDDKPKAEAAAS